MKQYLKDLKFVLENGIESTDRTGTGTISHFGLQTRYDLKESLPIITTKRVPFKTVLAELLWFVSGNTNERRLAEILYGADSKYLKDKSTIWSGNANEQGKGLGYLPNDDYVKELGPIYGANWRKFNNGVEYVFPVKKKKAANPEFKLEEEILEPYGNNSKIGLTEINKFGQEYKIISYENERYTIQFTKTKSIYSVNRTSIKSKNMRDGFEPSLYDIGCLGYYKGRQASDIDKRLRKTWEMMISRCYNPNDCSYTRTQAQDICVCDRWLIASNFIEDAKKLMGFNKYKKNLEPMVLDKDYYGNNIYSPETSVFIKASHNRKYRKDSCGYVYEIDGSEIYFVTRSEVRNYFACNDQKIKQLKIPGLIKFEHGDYVLRYKDEVDQLQECIDLIRTNPDSRRIILTSWNPSTLDNIALPSCHAFFQFYVRNGKLSGQLYQRSADMFLGVPFNITSYSLLLAMIAQITDLGVGELVHTIGDAHIYLDHLDQVKEQLEREPLEGPGLHISNYEYDDKGQITNKEIRSIDQFKMDQFELIDYQHLPTIKAKMSV